MSVLKRARSNNNAEQLFFDKSDEKLGDGFIRQSFKYKVTNRSLYNLSSKLLEIVQSNSKKLDNFHDTNIVRCSWRFVLYQADDRSVEKKTEVPEVNVRVLNQKSGKSHKKRRSASYFL